MSDNNDEREVLDRISETFETLLQEGTVGGFVEKFAEAWFRGRPADKVILKDSAETIIAKYDLLSEAERITAKNAATKKIGGSS